jgi:hypothetical protein
MRRMLRARLLSFVAFAMLAAVWPLAAQAAGPGAADAFSVLADSTGLTCTDSTVSGPVGIATSTTPVTQTSCVMPTPQVAPGAYAAFRKIYNNIAANLFPCTILSGTLADQSLGAGTYCFPAAAALTGTLTLTGSGPWLFEIGTNPTGGALAATNFTVVGGSPCSVTWWVRDAVTFNPISVLQGTILVGVDMTMTNTTLTGRAWATGALTMTNSTVSGCTGVPVPVPQHPKHCNQGVGNGPEGCDPGNSNHMHTSNDELGGTPGDPGRQPEKLGAKGRSCQCRQASGAGGDAEHPLHSLQVESTGCGRSCRPVTERCWSRSAASSIRRCWDRCSRLTRLCRIAGPQDCSARCPPTRRCSVATTRTSPTPLAWRTPFASSRDASIHRSQSDRSSTSPLGTTARTWRTSRSRPISRRRA